MWWGIPTHFSLSWGDGVRVVEEEMGIRDQYRSNTFFSLNQVGLEIALQIDDKTTIGDLLVWLQTKYNLDPEHAERDLINFLRALNRDLLINFQGAPWYVILSCVYQTLQHCLKTKTILPVWSIILFFRDLRWRESIHLRKKVEAINIILHLSTRIFLMWFPWWILISFIVASIFILTTNSLLKGVLSLFLTTIFLPLSISVHETTHLVALGPSNENKRVLTYSLTGIFVMLPYDASSSQILLSSLAGPSSNLFLMMVFVFLGLQIVPLQWELWGIALWNGLIGITSLINDGMRAFGGLWLRKKTLQE